MGMTGYMAKCTSQLQNSTRKLVILPTNINQSVNATPRDSTHQQQQKHAIEVCEASVQIYAQPTRIGMHPTAVKSTHWEYTLCTVLRWSQLPRLSRFPPCLLAPGFFETEGRQLRSRSTPLSPLLSAPADDSASSVPLVLHLSTKAVIRNTRIH